MYIYIGYETRKPKLGIKKERYGQRPSVPYSFIAGHNFAQVLNKIHAKL